MKKKTVDELDIKILNILQENSGISNQELAERVGLSASPTLRRVENLWLNKILQEYKATISFERFGYTLRYVVNITAVESVKEDLLEILKGCKFCTSIFEVAKPDLLLKTCNFLVIFSCRDEPEYLEFVATMENFSGAVKVDYNTLINTVRYNSIYLDEADVLK